MLHFENLQFFIMWRLSAWRSASAYKISPKSDNRSINYDQKSEFQDGDCRHLEFQQIHFLVTWLSLGSISDVVYQISSKSNNFSLLLLLLVCVSLTIIYQPRTASSSAECSRDKPPFSFVREQDSTMWDIVWVSPQGHRSVSVSRHFLLQAPQCPCSVRK